MSFLAHNRCDVEWIIDSCTMSHMVNNKKHLTDFKKVKSTIGVAKANETMVSEGVGAVELETCTLRNVMYIPELSANLLSVSAITKSGGKMIFTENKVIVEKDNVKILKGDKKENGLYKIKLCSDVREESHAVGKISAAESWHRKLGHLGVDGMKNLLSVKRNISRKDLKNIATLCETCSKAKQTRLPFEGQRTRAERPLELIHTDLCGPMEIPTWDDKKYILTLLDDYTHLAFIYLLKNRYKVPETIKEYTERVEAKWNLKLAKLRCDNRREYVNKNLQEWCKRKGINMDCTVPYTPQLNGKAERLNRTC